MPFDGIFLRYVKNEILSEAVPGRVEKIHQPSREELVIHLRTRNGNRKLFLCVRADCPRIHFTELSPENPATPPNFCLLLRKRLAVATLADVRQAGLDRVLYLDFDTVNEIGDRKRLTLAIEIMSRCSNIILIDGEGVIVDALKKTDLMQSASRQIIPGFRYTCPPSQGKLDVTAADNEAVLGKIRSFGGLRLSSAVLSSVDGVSPLVSRELAGRLCDRQADSLSPAETEYLSERISSLRERITNNTASPVVLIDENGKPADFSYTEIMQYGDLFGKKYFESISAAPDFFYSETGAIERTRQKAHDLIKIVSNLIARTAKKLNRQREELEHCADREQLRINAELINANLYRLEKGAPFYDVENYYDNNRTLRIKADPSRSPAANAQRYFKEYRKAKTAEQMLTELIAKGTEELLYLESVSDALERAERKAETDEIRAELIQGGYIKQKSKNKGNGKKIRLQPPMEYVTSDGFRVLVGRNNMQNDVLSLRTAAKADMWLHTQKFPGSHVIIVSDGREISDDAIVEAAEIAAYHSKARDAKLVPVDYTHVRNLKKPPSAPPGKVIYHVYYSVNVTPEKEKIEKMLVKA